GSWILAGESATANQRLARARAALAGLPDNQNSRWLALLCRQLAVLLEFDRGRPSSALTEAARAAVAAESLASDFHPVYGTLFEDLARQRRAAALCQLGRTEEGTAVLRGATAADAEDRFSSVPALVAEQATLGLCLLKSGHRE